MTIIPKDRPKTLSGHTHKVETGCGKLYVTVNRDEDCICEVFAHLGKSGQCGSAQIEAICRAVSIGLRSGVGAETYERQLKGIICSSPKMWPMSTRILSCGDGIAHALRIEIENEKMRSSIIGKIIKEEELPQRFIEKMNEEGEPNET